MRHKLGLWAIGLLYILMGATVIQSIAQPNSCSPLVTQALQSVGTNCQSLTRNAACYGYDRVDVRFATTVEEGFFSQPADITPLLDVADIRTHPLDLVTERWGIALMNVQANIPNTLPGQAVTFMLLGDVQVQNDVTAADALTVGDPVRVIVTAAQRVNLRGGPGTDYNVAGNADPGQPFDVDARSADSQWVRLSGFEMWLSRSLVAVVDSDVDLTTLPVASLEPKSPMQAFYFKTGLGVPTCAEAPDVLVLQGPEAARVQLTANGAEVELGSTAIMKSTTDTFSTLVNSAEFGGLVSGFDAAGDPTCLATEMTLLEGDALVNKNEEGDDSEHVPLGHQSRSVTCLDANNAPAFTSQWSEPERMTDEELATFGYVEGLPLPREVTLPTQEEIDASIDRGPNVKPTPTRLAVIARPTRIPSTPDPSRPAATATPEGQTGGGTTPSCATFRATSPFGPVGEVVTFYWDQAQNVYGYQLELTLVSHGNVMGGTTTLHRVGSTETNITVDLHRTYGSTYFYSTGIRWRLQVLVLDASNNPTAFCETQYFDNGYAGS